MSMSYRRFAAMIVVSTAVMFGLKYSARSRRWKHLLQISRKNNAINVCRLASHFTHLFKATSAVPG